MTEPSWDPNFRSALKNMYPLIWHYGPAPVEELLGQSPRIVAIKYNFEDLKSSWPPDGRFLLVKCSPSDVDWEYMPTYLKGIALMMGRKYVEKDGKFHLCGGGCAGIHYGEFVRILIIEDLEGISIPESIQDVVWPCGGPHTEASPRTPELKEYPMDTFEFGFPEEEEDVGLKERKVAHHIVQRNLWASAMMVARKVYGKDSFLPTLQANYEEAVGRWADQRIKYGLHPGVEDLKGQYLH